MCGEMMDMPRRKEVRARLFKLERFIYRIGCCWYSSAARESRESDPNRTNFTVINCLDPKGSIPQVIVNSVSAKRAYFFKHLVDDYLATTNKT